MTVFKKIRSLLLRPSLIAALVSFVAYSNVNALYGKFAYDDLGSVQKNPVVNGLRPFSDVFKLDYWGTPMSEISSHKSFRPITTASFRLNWLVAEYFGSTEQAKNFTLGFHLVNVGLHAVVTGLATETAAFVFDEGTTADTVAQLIVGLLFGLHPVHAEAVSNITSRGELFMSLFFCLAFLSYAYHIPNARRTQSQEPGKLRAFFGIYVIPYFFMGLSMFSKEQGATTLMTLAAYDFLNNAVSLEGFILGLQQREKNVKQFFRRMLILAIQTISLCLYRMWLNGETEPDFIFDQNPAAFSENRFTRTMSVNWVYCLYIRDAIFPKYLSCDWSGRSIPLIETLNDNRVLVVFSFWAIVAQICQSLVFAPEKTDTPRSRQSRRVVLIAFFAFTFCPFLLSSNLLVRVGLMKGDRVIYLPLFGLCILEALAFKLLFCKEQEESSKARAKRASRRSGFMSSGVHGLGYIVILTQLSLFSLKLNQRNVAWSDSLLLWESAYNVNPRSSHTIYNYGYELALDKQYQRSEEIMRPVASARVDGPSNTYIYAMALKNLNRCDETHPFIDEALQFINEEKADPNNKRKGSLVRTESNLHVVKAMCTSEVQEMGRLMYRAVEIDPSNHYAREQAEHLLKKVQMLQNVQGS